MKIKTLKYSGEADNGSGSNDNMQPASMTSSTLKKIFFEDVTLLTDEFCFNRSASDDLNASNVDEISETSTDEEGAQSENDTDYNSETESKPERKRSNSEEIKPLKLGSLLGKLVL